MFWVQHIRQIAEQWWCFLMTIIHKNLQVYYHKGTKTCRFIKVLYNVFCYITNDCSLLKGRLFISMHPFYSVFSSTTQIPPLSGPSLRIMPCSCKLFMCFAIPLGCNCNWFAICGIDALASFNIHFTISNWVPFNVLFNVLSSDALPFFSVMTSSIDQQD